MSRTMGHSSTEFISNLGVLHAKRLRCFTACKCTFEKFCAESTDRWNKQTRYMIHICQACDHDSFVNFETNLGRTKLPQLVALLSMSSSCVRTLLELCALYVAKLLRFTAVVVRDPSACGEAEREAVRVDKLCLTTVEKTSRVASFCESLHGCPETASGSSSTKRLNSSTSGPLHLTNKKGDLSERRRGPNTLSLPY